MSNYRDRTISFNLVGIIMLIGILLAFVLGGIYFDGLRKGNEGAEVIGITWIFLYIAIIGALIIFFIGKIHKKKYYV